MPNIYFKIKLNCFLKISIFGETERHTATFMYTLSRELWGRIRDRSCTYSSLNQAKLIVKFFWTGLLDIGSY